MDNILSIKKSLVERVKQRRKERDLSQQTLAERSLVSFGSIKRFERSGEISLSALLRVALLLGCENDFAGLFQENFSLNNTSRSGGGGAPRPAARGGGGGCGGV
ncbi:MAG: helix-turn-helix domain-containing protein, partial [Candidatus Margulisbacteria bacterium]|nr:helix-turn-helix domain-containing protein [Candidatus Margulisiibacteriota bacterium]